MISRLRVLGSELMVGGGVSASLCSCALKTERHGAGEFEMDRALEGTGRCSSDHAELEVGVAQASSGEEPDAGD